MSQGGGESYYDAFMPKINDVAQKYIDDLMAEKARLPKEFILCSQVIDDAIDRIYATGRIPGKELQADVYKQLPIKVTQNVHIPVKQFPKFNFVGKLIGPKGHSLKKLNQETLCYIAIKGRSSMRDEEKEEALRQSGNPAFNHLNKNLFVEISTVAPPAEAYARISYALAEIRKYIIPDKNDEISQEQYRELQQMRPEYVRAKPPVPYRSVLGKFGVNESYRGYHGSDYDRYDDYEEYESAYSPRALPPPPPPTISSRSPGSYRAPAPRRPPEPSSYHDRKEYRPRPYQSFPLYKK
ncbi:KH domain-containing, RNA-binding, signal transduction-associated protein 3-like [Musca autumnalis]|uniref:KH domain-containing, RNA-binding, signal transduction-associated protein 3-like n=1 Tax=Musca autumnalis TaxID=221902 RepID=UPI003CF326CE